MGDVISFHRLPEAVVDRETIQVSRYAQPDGTDLFCIEILHRDGTWDRLDHSRDRAHAWKRAGQIANQRGAPLLPDSIWPGRSSLP